MIDIIHCRWQWKKGVCNISDNNVIKQSDLSVWPSHLNIHQEMSKSGSTPVKLLSFEYSAIIYCLPKQNIEGMNRNKQFNVAEKY